MRGLLDYFAPNNCQDTPVASRRSSGLGSIKLD
jgi:hypothetical protein